MNKWMSADKHSESALVKRENDRTDRGSDWKRTKAPANKNSYRNETLSMIIGKKEGVEVVRQYNNEQWELSKLRKKKGGERKNRCADDLIGNIYALILI